MGKKGYGEGVTGHITVKDSVLPDHYWCECCPTSLRTIEADMVQDESVWRALLLGYGTALDWLGNMRLLILSAEIEARTRIPRRLCHGARRAIPHQHRRLLHPSVLHRSPLSNIH